LGLIVIEEISPRKVAYSIRQKRNAIPSTRTVSHIPSVGLDEKYWMYMFGGFMTLKKAVDAWVFEYTQAVQGADESCAAGAPEAILIPYPTLFYGKNPFYASVGFLFGLAMILSTMYPMSKLAKSVVEEKELRMRELMKIMGLRDWIHQLSWFLSALVLFLWIAISCTFITTISFIKASSPLIIFLYFFLFAMSEANLAFLVSVFFSNSKLAAIAAPVVIFAAILPRYIFYTVENNEEVANKVLACFLSPTAFVFGADFISTYESVGVGIQSYNLFEGKFNFGICLLMMFLDFFVYGFLAWYLDQILPQEYGTPKHPLFIFNRRYWRGTCMKEKLAADRSQIADFEDLEEFHGQEHDNDRIERLPAEMLERSKVMIKHLAKTYSDGKVAVRDLSLTMLEGQITCLLGHNGAGDEYFCSFLYEMLGYTDFVIILYDRQEHINSCIDGYD
jgi:ABC-type multidrug transport system fused ATPase/permease subunit